MARSVRTVAHRTQVEITWQDTMFWVEVKPVAKPGYAQLTQDLIVLQEAIAI